MGKRLPKSIRKFIRKEKARIRREVFDLKEQERLIKELYKKIKPVTTYKIETRSSLPPLPIDRQKKEAQGPKKQEKIKEKPKKKQKETKKEDKKLSSKKKNDN